jgi:DNA-binding NarL/FixJ family response regulator
MEPGTFCERYARLTPRQREVLVLRCRGATNEEVARQLFLQECTVRNRMTSLLAQLGVRGRCGSAAVCAQIRTLRAVSSAQQ